MLDLENFWFSNFGHIIPERWKWTETRWKIIFKRGHLPGLRSKWLNMINLFLRVFGPRQGSQTKKKKQFHQYDLKLFKAQTFEIRAGPLCLFSPSIVILIFIIKFPYNTCSDWLEQRALSENRARVEAGFQIFASEFWQIWAKWNIPCDSYKRNGNELFAFSEYGSRRPLLVTVVIKLY